MRTTNPAKAKIVEITEKIVFPDATEQVTAYKDGSGLQIAGGDHWMHRWYYSTRHEAA